MQTNCRWGNHWRHFDGILFAIPLPPFLLRLCMCPYCFKKHQMRKHERASIAVRFPTSICANATRADVTSNLQRKANPLPRPVILGYMPRWCRRGCSRCRWDQGPAAQLPRRTEGACCRQQQRAAQLPHSTASKDVPPRSLSLGSIGTPRSCSTRGAQFG